MVVGFPLILQLNGRQVITSAGAGCYRCRCCCCCCCCCSCCWCDIYYVMV